jgi:hypothetical protein
MKIKSRRIVGLSLTATLVFAAAIASHRVALTAVESAPAAGKAFAPSAAVTSLNPGAAAATQCPPYSFVNNINLAKNPSFEVAGPNGPSTTWQAGGPDYPPSAANNWLMHSSNSRATVSSKLEPTNVPGPGGARMLHFIAGGNEGGIYQRWDSAPAKLMFSVWVFVKTGHLAVQANAGTSGPSAWSTKHNEWEQLRVCTDGTVPTGYFIVWNEDASGGDFFVDRVEIRETP